ncbi:MAG: FtsX-like permease family protein [Venatoribacter sp.]
MLALRLASRFLWREAKSGELTLIFLALLLAVTSATAIALFSSRLDAAMQLRSNQFLGADLRIESTVPLNPAWQVQAQKLGLKTTTTVHFPTVVLFGDEMAMASAKAVEENYPLKSTLLAGPSLAQAKPQKAGPKPGEAWVEPRLLAMLEAQLGDALEVGNIQLNVTAVIAEESDKSAGFYSFSPRLMLNQQDLEQTGLVSLGSRIRWRLLLTGTPDQQAQFKAYLDAHPLDSNQKLQSLENSNEMLANRLQSAQRYLGLAAMLAVILAAVAVGISAKHYALRHFDASALMRTFGLSRALVWQVYLWQLLLLGLVATALGLFSAYLLQTLLLYILADLAPSPLPLAPISAWLLGGSVGLVSLLGFAVPHLLPLAKVPPLRVLRRDIHPVPFAAWLISLVAMLALALLLYMFTQDAMLASYVLVGGAAFVGITLALLMGVIAWLKKRLANKTLPFTWRFAWQHLSQNSLYSAGQILAFSLTIMVMLLIASLRNDLLNDWQQSLPANSPNVFAINIQPYELEAFQQALTRNQIAAQKVFATVPGRLVKINQQEIKPQDFAKDASIDRDLILTATTELPKGNQIVSGDWSRQQQTGQVSVEEKLAKRLGLSLGDTLYFRIADSQVQAEVSSIRQVDWGSMTPNFFMIFSPDVLAPLPTSYMTSFYYQDAASLTLLVREFPTITFMDIKAVLEQIQNLLEQVTLAIELILGFVLLAALLVMLSSLVAGVNERLKEGAILRTLGASRKALTQSQRYEFATLALVSSLLALVGAELIRFFLYQNLLNIPWQLLGWAWLLTPISAVLLLTLAGMALLKPAVQVAPLAVLREL